MSIANPSQSEHDAIVDTLRLSADAYRQLLDQVESCAQPDLSVIQKRCEQRHRYAAPMVICLRHPGGSEATYLARVRNISSHGVGFFHGGFLYKDTRCCIFIPGRDRRWFRITGTVVRCRHVRQHTHEVGILFDEAINLADIIEPEKCRTA